MGMMARSTLLIIIAAACVCVAVYQVRMAQSYSGIRNAITKEYMMVEWVSKDAETCGLSEWRWTRRAGQSLEDFMEEVAALQAQYPPYTP